MFKEFRPEELQCTGVYMILNVVNNKCYIGSTDINFKTRWNQHICLLRNNRHHNKYFQRSWNKYKENNFKFIILEFTVKSVSNNYILAREQWYLDFYLPQFNTCKIAGNTKGQKPWLGKTHSEETRKKFSLAKTGKNNPMYGKTTVGFSGKKHSEETRKKLSLASTGNIGKLSSCAKSYIAVSPKGISYIFKGLRNFCREYNLPHSSMSEVARGKRKDYKGWSCQYHEEQITA